MADLTRDTQVRREAPGRYTIELSEEWAAPTPMGGFLAGIALRAAAAEGGMPRPASIACQFLRVGRFDEPVEIEACAPPVAPRRCVWSCARAVLSDPEVARIVEAGLGQEPLSREDRARFAAYLRMTFRRYDSRLGAPIGTRSVESCRARMCGTSGSGAERTTRQASSPSYPKRRAESRMRFLPSRASR